MSHGALIRVGVHLEGCGERVSPLALPAVPPTPVRCRRQRSSGVTAVLPRVRPRICGFWRRKRTGERGCATKQDQFSRWFAVFVL